MKRQVGKGHVFQLQRQVVKFQVNLKYLFGQNLKACLLTAQPGYQNF